MKITTIILGITLLGTTYLPFHSADCCRLEITNDSSEILRDMNQEFEASLLAQATTGDLDLNSLEIVEAETPVDLGFDTTPYLPEGFNPYLGMSLDFSDLDRADLEEVLFGNRGECESGAANAVAHSRSYPEPVNLHLAEIEEEIDLGFDTAAYLPAGFDPYSGMEHAGAATAKTLK